MIRYCDTGPFNDRVCPGLWFDSHVIAGIQAFRGQFGFFRFGAMRKYANVLRSLAMAKGHVSLVLGSNVTDPLTIEDARELLAVFSAGTNTHLSVVALGNALFHPKVAHVVTQDGTAEAIVGSANFTELALGTHVEAWIELSSDGVVDSALADIAVSIDKWHNVAEAGVYRIRNEADALRLLEQGILTDQARRRRDQATNAGTRLRSSGRGTRRARWRPPASSGRPSVERESETEIAETKTEPRDAARGQIVLRWSKRLSASDVNKNARHIRNLMSLTKAKLIDDLDYFRNVFFSDADWQSTTIRGHSAEIARVRFEVKLPSTRRQSYTLEIVHAPHRESGQHNYHTSIRWGPLGSMLHRKRGLGFTGHWCVLEKRDTGEYNLTISPNEPAPRFIG